MGVLLAIRGFFAVIPPFVWKCIAVFLIGAALFFYGDIHGARVENAKWQQAKIEAQNAANQQDTQAATEVQSQDKELTNSLLEQKKVDDAAIEDLKKQLADRPTASPCLYDKTNGDPDTGAAVPLPKPRSLLDRARDKVRGAGNKKATRPAVVSPAGKRP